MGTRLDNMVQADSCWNKAEPDEPLFILRANDPRAPDLVRTWAALYRGAKSNGMSDTQFRKYRSALDIADQMEAWARAHPDDDIPF